MRDGRDGFWWIVRTGLSGVGVGHLGRILRMTVKCRGGGKAFQKGQFGQVHRLIFLCL